MVRLIMEFPFLAREKVVRVFGADERVVVEDLDGRHPVRIEILRTSNVARGARRGVSKGVEDGRRPPALHGVEG
jgi:hypothetical protein